MHLAPFAAHRSDRQVISLPWSRAPSPVPKRSKSPCHKALGLMQCGAGISNAVLLVGMLFVACVLEAHACGDHPPAWQKTVEVHGRRRSLLSFKARRCGTLEPEAERMNHLEYKHAVFAAKESAQVTNGGVREYTIPTYVWIVTANDGTKVADIAKSTVERQLADLNTAYATASDASGIKYTFKVESITKVPGPDMCDQGNEAKMKQQLRKGGSNALNLYITDLSACGLLGYSSWPWDLSKKGLTMDGVVIHYDTLPGGNYKPYNMGRTTIHEIGHWLGLYHTFQNGCGGTGDAVEDTPFCAAPTEGCPAAKDTCPDKPGKDPVSNFMDYSDDSCMRAFSAGQHQRIEQMWKQYRLAV